MTALAIALSAALLGVLIFLVALRRSSWRGGRKPEAEELKRAQFELRWARQLSGLAETLDLDELLARVLQGASLLASADAAAVTLWPEG